MLSILIFAVLLLCLVVLGLRSFKNSGFCLAIVWASFAMEQLFQARSSYFVQNGSIFNYGIATFVGLTCVALAFRGKLKITRFPKPAMLYIAMLAICGFSLIWAVDPDTTMKYLKPALPYICVFSLAAPFCVQTSEELMACCKAMVFFGSVVLLGHAFTEIGRRGIMINVTYEEAKQLNPLAVASFAGNVVICTAFWIYYRRDGGFLRTITAVVVIGLGIYTIVRSGSRGQMIGVVAVIAVWLPLTAKMALKKFSVGALLGAVALAIGTIFTIQQMGWAGSWDPERVQNAASGRFDMVKEALNAYSNGDAAQMLFGFGSSSSWDLLGGYPHNLPVEVLLEQGIVGLTLLCTFIACVFLIGFKLLRMPNLPQASRVGVGLILCLFSFEVFLSLKQGTFLQSTVMFGMGITALLLYRNIKKAGREKTRYAMYLPQPAAGYHQPQR